MTFLVSFISYDVSSLLIQVISAQKYYKNTMRKRKNEKSAQVWETREKTAQERSITSCASLTRLPLYVRGAGGRVL